MAIYATLMNKGGVGKTTLITNLASAMAQKEPDKKILIIDADGQGNSSISFSINPNSLDRTLYDCWMNDVHPKDVIFNAHKNIDLLPSNRAMNKLDFEILPRAHEYENLFGFLQETIEQLPEGYDDIFIDSPPHLALVAGNVTMVADEVIIPYVPESFAVAGLMETIETITEFRENLDANLHINGVVGMKIESNTNLHKSLLLQADIYCKKNDINMMKTVIPKSIRFADATAAFGIPFVLANKNHPMSKYYFSLMDEMVQNTEVR
jgi:chromosome partitioning protein